MIICTNKIIGYSQRTPTDPNVSNYYCKQTNYSEHWAYDGVSIIFWHCKYVSRKTTGLWVMYHTVIPLIRASHWYSYFIFFSSNVALSVLFSFKRAPQCCHRPPWKAGLTGSTVHWNTELFSLLMSTSFILSVFQVNKNEWRPNNVALHPWTPSINFRNVH